VRSLVAEEDPSEGRVMPLIAHQWGVSLEGVEYKRTQTGAAGTREAISPSADVSVLGKDDVVPLLAWALVNPYGPTFAGLGARERDAGGSSLVVFSLNPFQQDVRVVEQSESPALGAWTGESLGRKLDELDLVPAGVPTLLVVGPGVAESEARHVFRHILAQQASLSRALDLLVRFPGDPVNRISEGVSQGFEDAMQGLSKRRTAGTRSVPSASEDIQRFLEIARQGKHILEEVKALAIAWQGAIDFQARAGAGVLAKNALKTDIFLPILIKFVASDPACASLAGTPPDTSAPAGAAGAPAEPASFVANQDPKALHNATASSGNATSIEEQIEAMSPGQRARICGASDS